MESSSIINQPHPDETPEDAEAFFGEPDLQDQDPGAFDPEPAPQPEPVDPTPAESGGTTGSATEPLAEPQPEPEPQAPQAEGPPKQSGSVSREYIVFHRLALTENVLKHLAQELESGARGGEPRFAYFEIHRAQARNATDAVAEGYDKHQERLGDTVDVAAVSRKAFQERHIAPKERPVQRSISIVKP